jgi:hypothetical protein
VHAHRASSTSVSRAVQQSEWRRARELYASAISRIGAVAAAVTIDFTDRVPLENAQAGLARTDEALRTFGTR